MPRARTWGADAEPSLKRISRRKLERLDTVLPVDRRSKLGKSAQRFRESLITHCGGAPSVTEMALINMAEQLFLRLQILDTRFMCTAAFDEHFDRQYLAWSNSLQRLLSRLGLKGRPEAPETLVEYVRRRSAGESPADILDSLDAPITGGNGYADDIGLPL